MADFLIDPQASDLIQKSPSDGESARELLKIAAKYLRNREVLPDDLADYIADALEVAASKQTSKECVKALGHELHLTARNRRPKNKDWYEIGLDYERLLDSGLSQNAIQAELAALYEISETKINKLWKEYKRVTEEYKRISLEEDQED